MTEQDFSFVPMKIIDKHLEESNKSSKKSDRIPHRYWPSQASLAYIDDNKDKQIIGKCMRSIYYQMIGEAPSNPFNARTMRILTIGKQIEQIEIEWAKEAGVYHSNNVKFEHAFNNMTISGEVDAFFKSPTYKKYGVEYKTGYGYMFHSEVFGNTRRVGFPKKDHLLQVMLYLDHFDDVPYFNIIYIDRGDMTHKTHKIALHRSQDMTKRIVLVNDTPYDLFSMSRIYKRYSELDQYLEKKQIPDREFELFYSNAKVERLHKSGKLSKKKYDDHKKGKRAGDWQCSYCSFLKLCWGKSYGR